MLDRLRGRLAQARERIGNAIDVALGQPPRITLDALSPYSGFGFGGFSRFDNGSKFEGGFGETELLTADYWTLRARSAQLFETNLYARGLLRRLVTNEITTGLHLEATPREKLLGKPEDSLAEWAEDVETHFELWGDEPWLCDHMEQQTFGALQVQARLEALIEGDVLVVLRQFQPTQLPRVQLIKGGMVQTPYMSGDFKLATGHRILHGVELDALDRPVGYWVTQRDGTSKRLPAYGEKSGRRIAWLLYGTEKRLDDVRGKPVLSLVLQSLREIDRYRDATQRKAVINSMLAMFVKKTEKAGTGSRPMLSGATRRGTVETPDAAGQPPRRFNVAEMIPGLVLDELAYGEEPQGFAPNGTDAKFGEFEEALIQTIAWSFEIPPEILRLAFSSNYSASQAAINELKIYLNKVRVFFGCSFTQPIYVEWLIAMALTGKVTAPGLLDAWRDVRLYDLFASWVSADWSGNIKPAMDMLKQAKAYDQMISMGVITRDRATRELTGTKFSQNVKKLRLENEALARARVPMQQFDTSFAPAAPSPDDDADEGKGGEEEDASMSSLRVVS